MEKERIGIFGQVCVRLKVSNIRDIMGFNYNKKGSFKLPFLLHLKSASNLNGNLNCSKELEHYAS